MGALTVSPSYPAIGKAAKSSAESSRRFFTVLFSSILGTMVLVVIAFIIVVVIGWRNLGIYRDSVDHGMHEVTTMASEKFKKEAHEIDETFKRNLTYIKATSTDLYDKAKGCKIGNMLKNKTLDELGPICGFGKDIGKGFKDAGKAIGHTASKAWHSVSHWF